ncbi:outer membrane beta-barrel protein [Pedobacter endophyticus]|uniref:Outer membrane beta-barrel protein n=1 Tax=Pedobacter endophyticus TaxID=2789740 RepID=A0A7S9L0U5_9SPHI|nr:outer membrane beta-barrel protein [Pedobacter endophyticus]QPH40333.1 outer membrane beta-barrel protein [Pedobacter endophyticus]
MLKQFLTVVFLFIFFLPGLAQKASIKGVVIDTVEKRKLQNSSILLIRSKDSVLVKDVRAGANGTFQLANLQKGTYTLLVTFPKMADYIRDIQLSDTSKFNLGDIAMDSRATLLNEVVIKAQKQAISMKGDTITYQADSFAVKPHANVQDLLRRLPGIEVDRDGAIKAGGKDVNTLLVDGEEFFGDDPLLASKYLKANAVKEVQVYDKKTKEEELTGIKSGDSKEKVMNIKLKDNAKNGYLSTIDANSDLKHFRNIGGMAGIYKGKLKAAAFGFNSNTNQNSKASAAMSKLKGNDYDVIQVGDDGSTVMISYGGRDDDSFSPSNGLPDVTNYGAHFSDKWNENKVGLKLNFSGNSKDITDRTTSNSQSLLPDGTNFFSASNANSNVKSQRQSLKGSVDLNLDSLSTLKISFAGSKNRSHNDFASNNETKNGTDQFVNNSKQLNRNEDDDQLFNGNINYTKKFLKRGRTLSVDLQPETKRGNSFGNSLSVTNYYDANGVNNRTVNQDFLNDNSGSETSLASKISYTEPLSKQFTLQTAYSFKTVTSNSSKLVFDKSMNNKRIDSLSNNFDFNNFSNIGKAVLQFRAKKFTLSGGTEAIQTTFEFNDLDRNNKFNRNYINWAPQSTFTYKLGRNTNAYINYYGNTRQPSLDQLQPLRQINNPLYEIKGNPNLKPSFNNNVNFNLNTYQQKSQMFASFYGGYNFTKNAIVSSRIVDDVNKTTSSYINLDGTNSYYGGASINKTFSKLHFSTGFNGSYNKSTSVSILNSQLNKQERSSLRLSPRFSYYGDKVRIQYTPTFMFSNSSSSIGSINDGKNFNHDHEISGNIQLPYNFEFDTSISLSYQPANSSFSRPVNIALWNAYLSKKMLKAQELELKISISDILAEKIGYNRYVGGNTISESTNSFIPRYVLIGLTYNLTGNFTQQDKK